MGLFDIFKKKANKEPQNPIQTENTTTEEYIDDPSFIRDMKHIQNGVWHQYDILLAAQIYGWNAMIMWGDYMADADIENISQVTVASLGVTEINIVDSFKNHNEKFSQMPELQTEHSALSLAGSSKALRAPVKIVWTNQTRVLRLFTLLDDDLLIRKYAESMTRRNFGTEDAMKLGKPLPKE